MFLKLVRASTNRAKARTGFTTSYSSLSNWNGLIYPISIRASSFTFIDSRESSMLLGFKESTNIANILSAIMF